MLPGLIVFVIGCIVIAGVVHHLATRGLSSPKSGPPLVDQAHVLQIVWADNLNMDLKLAPTIEWVTGSRLNCQAGYGWVAGNQCVAGMSYRDRNLCAVAWFRGAKISDTAYVHELLHAQAWHTGGNSDHFSADFQQRVARLNDVLRAAGL